MKRPLATWRQRGGEGLAVSNCGDCFFHTAFKDPNLTKKQKKLGGLDQKEKLTLNHKGIISKWCTLGVEIKVDANVGW